MAPIAAPQRRRSTDRKTYGAPVWLWKSLGTMLIGLLGTLAYDLVVYVHWVGSEVQLHDQKFLASDAKWVERKEGRDREVQDLKDRNAIIQGEVDQIRNDVRVLNGRK